MIYDDAHYSRGTLRHFTLPTLQGSYLRVLGAFASRRHQQLLHQKPVGGTVLRLAGAECQQHTHATGHARGALLCTRQLLHAVVSCCFGGAIMSIMVGHYGAEAPPSPTV